MYKIIGADQKEYGPITADQIIQWISEGRVAGHTQARLEGTEEWKPLSSFPEFAAALGITPAGAPSAMPPLSGYSTPDMSGREAVAGMVKGPAIALIVTAIIDILFSVLGLIQHSAATQFYSNMPQMQDPQFQRLMQMSAGPVGLLTQLFYIATSAVVLFGAIKMLSLKSYTFAFVAAIVAVIPCVTPCCGIITLPFGIWALVVLNKPGVKRCFE